MTEKSLSCFAKLKDQHHEPQEENQLDLESEVEKQNAKLHKSNKPRYISKAERAKMEAEEQANEQTSQVAEETQATDEA